MKAQASKLLGKLRSTDTRFVVSYGGAGSGKSHTQAQHEVLKMIEGKEKILVLRKVKDTLRDSVIPLIVDKIIPSFGVGRLFTHHKTDRILTCHRTGSIMLFRGMDDPEKIKSIEGITRIWIEEATEFTVVDVDQLNLRLRAMSHLQITLTLNPIDESHWIKKRFFDQPDPDITVIRTTYKDNRRFLPKSYIQQLEKYKILDFNYYRVYALGEWGKLDSGAELYRAFEPALNTTDRKYNPELPLHVTFDENVVPYLTALVFQAEGSHVWQVDEIMMEPPRNNLQDFALEFHKRYMGHGSGLIIYGDATSRKGDTKIERGHNFFTLVKDLLKDYHPRVKVPKANPSVFLRALFINEVFRHNIEGVRIEIGENCPKTIEDFKYIKEAPDGGKFKEMTTDPKTKVRFQKYGHATDAAEYFFTMFFAQAFREWQRGTTDSVNYIVGKKKLRGGY